MLSTAPPPVYPLHYSRCSVIRSVSTQCLAICENTPFLDAPHASKQSTSLSYILHIVNRLTRLSIYLHSTHSRIAQRPYVASTQSAEGNDAVRRDPMRRRTTSTVVLLNGMPQTIKLRQTRPTRWLSRIREGYERDLPLQWSRTGNECHLPMGGSPLMKNYDNRPLFYRRERRRLRRIGCHRPPRFTMPRAASCHDAVRMRRIRCVPRCICIRYRRDLCRRFESTMRIHDQQPRRQSKHTEMQFYRSTPSGRRWRLGAPWLPLRTSLRCLPPKHDFIRCGLMRQCATLYAAVLMRQSTTLHTAVLYAPKRYKICCGVYHQSATNYAAVSTYQCSTDTLRRLPPKLYETRTEASTILAPKYCGRRCLTAPKDAEVVTITEAGLFKSHKRRCSRIFKCTLSESLYASTLRF